MTAYKLPAVLAFMALCTVSALMAPRRATLPREAIDAPAPSAQPVRLWTALCPLYGGVTVDEAGGYPCSMAITDAADYCPPLVQDVYAVCSVCCERCP